MGAGTSSTHTSGGAHNYLKPILTQEGICIIGATTFREWTNYIQKTKPLVGRFDPVSIPTLSAEQVKKVLQGYEGFFHKKYGSWLDLPTR